MSNNNESNPLSRSNSISSGISNVNSPGIQHNANAGSTSNNNSGDTHTSSNSNANSNVNSNTGSPSPGSSSSTVGALGRKGFSAAQLPLVLKRYKHEVQQAKMLGMNSDKGMVHAKNAEKIKALLIEYQRAHPESLQTVIGSLNAANSGTASPSGYANSNIGNASPVPQPYSPLPQAANNSSSNNNSSSSNTQHANINTNHSAPDTPLNVAGSPSLQNISMRSGGPASPSISASPSIASVNTIPNSSNFSDLQRLKSRVSNDTSRLSSSTATTSSMSNPQPNGSDAKNAVAPASGGAPSSNQMNEIFLKSRALLTKELEKYTTLKARYTKILNDLERIKQLQNSSINLDQNYRNTLTKQQIDIQKEAESVRNQMLIVSRNIKSLHDASPGILSTANRASAAAKPPVLAALPSASSVGPKPKPAQKPVSAQNIPLTAKNLNNGVINNNNNSNNSTNSTNNSIRNSDVPTVKQEGQPNLQGPGLERANTTGGIPEATKKEGNKRGPKTGSKNSKTGSKGSGNVGRPPISQSSSSPNAANANVVEKKDKDKDKPVEPVFPPYNPQQPIYSKPQMMSYLKQLTFEEKLLLSNVLANNKVVIDPDVETLTNELVKEFLDSVIDFSSKLARYRNDTNLTIKDLKVNLERNWGIAVNGNPDGNSYTSSIDQITRSRKRPYAPTEAYINKLKKVYSNNGGGGSNNDSKGS